jgi:hypothetical protein
MDEAILTDDAYENERRNAEDNVTETHDDWLTESTRDASAGIWNLAERCRDFIWAELSAYARLVQRRELIPATQAVSRVPFDDSPD